MSWRTIKISGDQKDTNVGRTRSASESSSTVRSLPEIMYGEGISRLVSSWRRKWSRYYPKSGSMAFRRGWKNRTRIWKMLRIFRRSPRDFWWDWPSGSCSIRFDWRCEEVHSYLWSRQLIWHPIQEVTLDLGDDLKSKLKIKDKTALRQL